MQLKFTKECISGKDINLKKYNLNVIRQPRVDDFMSDYELSDFIKPFYLTKWLIKQNEEFIDIPLTYYIVMGSKDISIYNELIKSLKLLYQIDELAELSANKTNNTIKLINDEKNCALVIKKDGKSFAVIDDKNFEMLCDTVLEICQCDAPEKEKKTVIKGDPEKVKKILEGRAKAAAKKREENAVLFEEMVRNVIHYRLIDYNTIKDWTIFQIKDAYKVECFREQEKNQWLLFTSGNFKMKSNDLKHWADETKIKKIKE